MTGREMVRGLMLVAGVWLVQGCAKPALPTMPPQHMALTATVEINKNPYPVNFTWDEINFVAWNEGHGWHTEWKSTDRTCVRILDSKYAVIVWLPLAEEPNLNAFAPMFALVERDRLKFLRTYPELHVGEKRDGVFELTQLKIERAGAPFPSQPMTNDEQLFRAEIAGKRYGYLYGMMFTQDQWGQSAELKGLLGGLKGVTTLGKRARRRKEMSDVWLAFSTFNATTAMTGKMERHLFGCEFKGDAWVPLSYPGVYWHRAAMANDFGKVNDAGPVMISLRGPRFDQQQNELFFDGGKQELIVVWRYSLEPLEYQNQ